MIIKFISVTSEMSKVSYISQSVKEIISPYMKKKVLIIKFSVTSEVWYNFLGWVEIMRVKLN